MYKNECNLLNYWLHQLHCIRLEPGCVIFGLLSCVVVLSMELWLNNFIHTYKRIYKYIHIQVFRLCQLVLAIFDAVGSGSETKIKKYKKTPTAETDDQSCELNIHYVRTYSAKAFPYPI